MKLFQNKFFLICLCVAVVLCVVPSTLSLMGYGGLVKNVIGTVTTPFRWCITVVGNGFEGIGRYFESVEAVHDKNEELEKQNQALRDQLEDAALLEAENARLRSYLGMKAKYPTFLMEEGMVISYSAGNYRTSFTLNRGTLHGITVNMPVAVSEGVVGYVTDVGLNWCMVSTILEIDTSVGVYIPRSGATGILSGDAALRHDGLCRITYIEAGADIAVGDRVLSSGNGSIYPAELTVGEVVAIEVDEYSRTLVATVKPSVDFSSLKYMLIITGYARN